MSKLDIRETLQQLESQLEKMIRNAERSAKTSNPAHYGLQRSKENPVTITITLMRKGISILITYPLTKTLS